MNGQEVPCLTDTSSKVTVMEYDFYTQQFGARDQLDPCWLCLKVANNLPILVEGVAWVRIQIDDGVVDQKAVVVTRRPVSSAVTIVLGMNVVKRLGLAPLAGQV